MFVEAAPEDDDFDWLRPSDRIVGLVTFADLLLAVLEPESDLVLPVAEVPSPVADDAELVSMLFCGCFTDDGGGGGNGRSALPRVAAV